MKLGINKYSDRKFQFLMILSLALVAAANSLLSGADEGQPAQKNTIATQQSAVQTVPILPTKEQLAFKAKVCQPQVHKLEQEYQSIKTYYPVLYQFAAELEKKLSDYERENLQQALEKLEALQSDILECQAKNVAACSRVKNSSISTNMVNDLIAVNHAAFSMLLKDYNRGKKRDLKMEFIITTNLFGWYRTVTFMPSSKQIRTHLGETFVAPTVFINAWDTRVDVDKKLEAHLLGSKNLFVSTKLKHTICDGFVAKEISIEDANDDDTSSQKEPVAKKSAP